MKILHVNQFCEAKGGTELYVRLISDELANRGNEVSLLCDEVAQRDVESRHEFHQVEGISAYLLEKDDGLTERVRDVVDRENPDVINIHNIHNSRVIRCMLQMRPTVRYVHDHTLFCPRRKQYDLGGICSHPSGARCVFYTYLPFLCFGAFSPKPWMTGRYYSSFRATMESNRRLKGLAVASRYMKQCLLINGFSEELIELLPYFTDVPEESPALGDSVLFVGRLIPEKGVHFILDALAEMGGDSNLVVVGDGPREYIEVLSKRVLRLGLTSRVEFVGDQPHDRLADFYGLARVVAVPSVWAEPFGIVGIEAMAHGRPVVAFDTGGIRDWLADGETGFLAPRCDTGVLGDRIKRLLDSKDLSTEMGEKGRALVRRKFNRADHMDRLLEFYRKACA